MDSVGGASRNSSTDSQKEDTNVNIHSGNISGLGSSSLSGNPQVSKGSQQTSPFAITSMLHDLSINSTNLSPVGPTSDLTTIKSPDGVIQNLLSDIGTGPFELRILGVPSDLTDRESHLLFSLADGIESIEVRENESNDNDKTKQIVAKIKNAFLLSQYSTILGNKDNLFGPTHSETVKIEVYDESSKKCVDMEKLKQLYDAQKNMKATSKLEMGTQRHSRFSFNDPFNSETGNSLVFPSNQSNSTGNPVAQLSGISENTLPIEPGIHSSQRTNSFLIRDNNDINESIWNNNVINNSLNGLVGSSQPQTPSVDWANDRKKSAAFYFPNNASQTNVLPPGTTSKQNSVTMPGQMPINDVGQQMHVGNIPANPSQPYASSTSLSSFNMVPQMHNENQAFTNSVNASDMNIMNHEQSRFTPFGPIGQNGAMGMQNNQLPTENAQVPLLQNNNAHKVGAGRMTPQRNNMSSNMVPKVGSAGTGNMAMGTDSQYNNKQGMVHSTASSTTNITNATASGNISQADLSLLARIPPPANPADQNPPCNTLYVGNLPSDATEQELRQLFSNQYGFRRLSFRNKNSNGSGHGHGPMCFVEFEDVSFATRALVELYGSQLPRSTVNTKGGIRLSFSKNPLGVRGPSNRRNTNNSAASITTSNSISSQNNQNIPLAFNKS